MNTGDPMLTEKNLVTEGQTLSDAIHMRFLEESDSQGQVVRQWVPEAGKGGWGVRI